MLRLEIVNDALIKAGQTPVAAVTESKASRLVNRQLKGSLDIVLSAHPWDEFKKKVTIDAAQASEEITGISIDGVIYRKTTTNTYVNGSTVVTYIPEHTLPGGFDPTTISDTGLSFDVSAKQSSITEPFITDNGVYVYSVGKTGDTIDRYELSTPFDLSTATFIDTLNLTVGTDKLCMEISSNGTTLCVWEASAYKVQTYTLAAPWQLSGATYVGVTTTAYPGVYGIRFNDDGTKLWMLIAGTPPSIKEYDLATAWDATTATLAQTVTLDDLGFFQYSFCFNYDYSIFFVFDAQVHKVYRYDMTVPGDVSTATLTSEFAFSGITLIGGYIPKYGQHVYVASDVDDAIYQLDMEGETETIPQTLIVDDVWQTDVTVQEVVINGSVVGTQYQVPVPYDFVRLVEETPKGVYYDRQKGQFVTELETFTFSYVALPTAAVLDAFWQSYDYDNAVFDSLDITSKVISVLSYNILANCIYGVTGDHNDTNMFKKLYAAELAKMTNVQAQQQRDQFLTASTDSWEDARG